MTSSFNLVTPCFFRADGVMCVDGDLCYSMPASKEVSPGVFQPMDRPPRVTVEGETVTCSVCEGKGVILTPEGKQLLMFLETFARPMMRDLVDELFEEREQH